MGVGAKCRGQYGRSGVDPPSTAAFQLLSVIELVLTGRRSCVFSGSPIDDVIEGDNDDVITTEAGRLQSPSSSSAQVGLRRRVHGLLSAPVIISRAWSRDTSRCHDDRSISAPASESARRNTRAHTHSFTVRMKWRGQATCDVKLTITTTNCNVHV